MIIIILIILACIYIFIDLMSKFFVSKFLKCLFKAIPLFINDLINLDRTVFRGYGFWLFCGLGGSGKTVGMVEYLTRMKKKYPKVKILTNFKYEYADGRINSWQDLLNTTNIVTETITEEEFLHLSENNKKVVKIDFDKLGNKIYRRTVNHGVIFGFDEIHLTFESTKWADAPDDLLDYISQQRKFHKQIVGSSQVFTRVNVKLREQTNFVIESRSLLFGRLVMHKYYHTPDYLANGEKMDKGMQKRKVAKRTVFVASDNLRNLYDTEEIMKDISVGKSKANVILDYLKGIEK